MARETNSYVIVGEETWLSLEDKEGNLVALTIVDTEDLKRVLQFRWWLDPNGYAITEIWLRTKDKQKMRLPLSDLIMETHRSTILFPITDHINRVRLDNRKKNLRICTRSENALNAKLRSDNISGHRGVHFLKRKNKYQAYINIDKKRVNLGSFDSFEEAVEARKRAEKEFNVLN